jgi:hypothetical protein
MVGCFADQHARAITIAITVGMTGRGNITDGDRGEPQALSGANVAFGTWAAVVVDDGSRSPKAR